jgi:lipoprotein-releasing system permease protein
MKYTIKIALRYIFTKRSFHFINVISIISFIGIIIGVASLIAVMAIFNGFRSFTEKQLIGFDPHLRILPKNGNWINNSDSLINKIQIIHEVKNAIPILQGRTIGIKKNNMQVFTLNSISPKDLSKVSDISKTTIAGTFFLGKVNDLSTIVLGAGLADRIKALPGDTISLISPKLIESSIKRFGFPNTRMVFVSGLFQTNIREFDNTYAYSNQEIGTRLFLPPANSFNSIDIKLDNLKLLEKTKRKLSSVIPENLELMTWYDLHKQLYQIMDFERILAFIVMSLIIIIAVFNILASLSMTVVEKKRDIGILKSLGASNKEIMHIFMFQGSLIGLISTIMGVIIGLAFCYGQLKYGWFKLDSNNFLISAIPVNVQFIDVFFTALLSILLSSIVSIYPARRAAKINIVNSIHSE